MLTASGERRYNLRGEPSRGGVGLDGVELSAAWVLLYGSGMASMELYAVAGQPELHTKESLLALDGSDSPSAAGCATRAREARES